MTKMRTKPTRAFMIFALAFCMTASVIMQGCPLMGSDAKSYSEMTPKERATYITSVYNDQYELYLREAKIPDMTEEKKTVMREKKRLMMQMYPYIATYNNYAERGVFAPEDIEMAVMDIMNKLLGL